LIGDVGGTNIRL